ncbi:MAG: hypothetical protein PHC98_03225 [Syntrophotalea acetylenica]|nr:hypothetical protein [Syntrophotalea acetylenica]
MDDWAILGGLSAVHQFTRVGCHAMISGGSMVAQDIAPYIIAQGDRAKAAGINLVGLKRRNFSDALVRDIKQAYKLMFRSNLRQEEALSRITAEISDAPEIRAFVDFIRASERGVAR